ncbi:histone H1.2-like [Odontomachus brunneus]|uniref:histone H1.2-like n=1 Tax=Odontomachus brunneus TaxID=486640 RepID=UPI0013F23722|nr:histone H1.2-like [Odontomachus brunneus]
MAGKRTKTVARERRSRVKPTKIAALVVSAIKDLREAKGSTSEKIAGYISYGSSMPKEFVKRQVKAALKRGVEHGILRRHRGHYFLLIGDELDRANRIAMRFARLPTPSPRPLARSKINSARKIKDRKRPRGIGNRVRKSKKARRSRSPSAVPSLTDKIADDDVAFATE